MAVNTSGNIRKNFSGAVNKSAYTLNNTGFVCRSRLRNTERRESTEKSVLALRLLTERSVTELADCVCQCVCVCPAHTES